MNDETQRINIRRSRNIVLRWIIDCDGYISVEAESRYEGGDTTDTYPSKLIRRSLSVEAC